MIFKNKKNLLQGFRLSFWLFSSDCCELKIITDNCIMLKQECLIFQPTQANATNEIVCGALRMYGRKAKQKSHTCKGKWCLCRVGSAGNKNIFIDAGCCVREKIRDMNLSLLRDFKNWYSMCFQWSLFST